MSALNSIKSAFENESANGRRCVAYAILLAFFIFYCWRIFNFTQERFIQNHDVWTYAAWVLNYSGGMVRRGLAGAVLFQTSSLEMLPYRAAWLVIGLYAALGAALLSSYFWAKNYRTFFAGMLCFHPLGLSYYIAEPTALGRGEIFYLLSLSLLSLLFRFWSASGAMIVFGLMLAVSVFIHETFVMVLVPIWLCLLYLVAKRSVSVLSFLTSTLLVVGAFIALNVFATKEPVAAQICASLGSVAPPTCTTFSQMFFLDQNFEYALNNTWLTVRQPGYFLTYAIGALLVLSGPILYVVFREPDAQRVRLVWLITSSAVTAFPVFVIATDWGRYQHMIFMTLMFALLLLELSVETAKSIDLTAPRRAALCLVLLTMGVVTVPTNGASLLAGPWVDMIQSTEYATLDSLDGYRCSRYPEARFCDIPILDRTHW